MKYNSKNSILFMLYSVFIGAIIGLIIWTFLKIMNTGIEFLWTTVPNAIQIPFYTIIICTLGGFLVGLCRKKLGDYPEELETVITKITKDGKYSYDHVASISILAILPLIFGGSISPEAGLTGVIAGLCSWVGDKFKSLFNEMQELTRIGISATLGTIFHSPMFGFVDQIESDEEKSELPKTPKIVLYFLAIFGALGIFILLNHFFGGDSSLATFDNANVAGKEWGFLIPLILFGLIAGYFYYLSHKLANAISAPLKDKVILKGILGGLLLGIAGTFLPYTMFSGEHQTHDILHNWQQIGSAILLLTAFVKLFITNTCITMGLKGGHFFPCIFSGICLGYAFSIISGVDPVFCVSVVTTTLMASIMKKPFATVLLLMMFFPMSLMPVMLLSAVIGSSIKIPYFLQEHNN